MSFTITGPRERATFMTRTSRGTTDLREAAASLSHIQEAAPRRFMRDHDEDDVRSDPASDVSDSPTWRGTAVGYRRRDHQRCSPPSPIVTMPSRVIPSFFSLADCRLAFAGGASTQDVRTSFWTG